MEYNFNEIEKKWQKKWVENKTYEVSNTSDKPKYYVLDMFPYPSGAGLHVGHPLGYIASDIYARYKRLKGFNVLHPMGYDAFGLPAEQYAIEHGIHPAVSTENNINTFRKQLDNIGFSYDWSREVRTSDPKYYKWTQWIFLQLFKSWFNRKTQKAEPIETLVRIFEAEGNANHPIPNEKYSINNLQSSIFTSDDWKNFDEATQQHILMEYRLAYCGYGEVNWCEALGTVLANDEVVNGVSERGGHPVVKKKLRQWYLRITEYADRLLKGLRDVDFSDAMKDMQTNWIGKSSGAEITFDIKPLTPNPSPKGEGSKTPSQKRSLFFDTKPTSASGFENAKQNRKNPTEAEDILWRALRNKNVNYKFRRQHPIGNYIADFVNVETGLLIEVDGGYHNTPDQLGLDKIRETNLIESGFTILRFSNEDVVNSIDLVLERIKNKADAISREQSPSPVGEGLGVRVYTTRPDTIFGVDFMVIAPEHELVNQIKSPEQTAAVDEYVSWVKSRSERERMAEKKISGVFTGAYAINPFDGREIPIWISEYVLAGYGTGAIMAVPCGDERDHKFAQHFNIPITNIIGSYYDGKEANPTKDAILENSGFINGLVMREAMEVVIDELEKRGIGTRKTNYKMRDAAFSRQRYWGEPFPIIWKEGIAYPLDESELPLELPQVESYKPGPEGEGPLANIPEWTLIPSTGGEGLGVRETNTMPGYAGSSWYFLRYMDPHNDKEFAGRQATDYWNQVDLYIGGTEHAVGHLLYSRLWTKVLHDLGHLGFDEPYKRLVNQGMIQGVSAFAIVVGFNFGTNMNQNYDEEELDTIKKIRENYKEIKNKFISSDLVRYLSPFPAPQNTDKKKYDEIRDKLVAYLLNPLPNDLKALLEDKKLALIPFLNFYSVHVPIEFVNAKDELDYEKLKIENQKFSDVDFITLDGTFICEREVEKMSKSKFNVVNPDDIIRHYGADTFRMYEMFLGPVEMSKPWDTKGIEGVHRFLKKLWRLFYDEKGPLWENSPLSTGGEEPGVRPTEAELKALHKSIKKIEDDTERFSFNTGVSGFMILVNELSDLKCHKKAILEPMLIMLAPYAPHIAEELWHQLGNSDSVLDATYPAFEEKYVKESSKEYPISINGKLRTTMNISLDASQEEVEKLALENEVVQKWLEGKAPKKIIFVKNKMVNVVI